jgi:peptide subunit release factor 1 (eRF1)
VSLYIPPKENIDKVSQMLTGELSSASGIKSKQTRTSVCTAITATKESKNYQLTDSIRTEALPQCASKWFSYLLWCDRNGRRKVGEENYT